MKTILVLLVTLMAGVASAAPRSYKIDMEMMVDGKVVSEPTMIVQEGLKASVESKPENGEATFIEVVASEKTLHGIDGILMDLEVGYVDATGARKVAARPRLLAKDGARAQVILNDKGKNQEVSIKAKATRVSR